MNKPKRNSNSTKITISLSKNYMEYYKNVKDILEQKTKKKLTLSQTIRLALEENSITPVETKTRWILEAIKSKWIK